MPRTTQFRDNARVDSQQDRPNVTRMISQELSGSGVCACDETLDGQVELFGIKWRTTYYFKGYEIVHQGSGVWESARIPFQYQDGTDEYRITMTASGYLQGQIEISIEMEVGGDAGDSAGCEDAAGATLLFVNPRMVDPLMGWPMVSNPTGATNRECAPFSYCPACVTVPDQKACSIDGGFWAEVDLPSDLVPSTNYADPADCPYPAGTYTIDDAYIAGGGTSATLCGEGSGTPYFNQITDYCGYNSKLISATYNCSIRVYLINRWDDNDDLDANFEGFAVEIYHHGVLEPGDPNLKKTVYKLKVDDYTFGADYTLTKCLDFGTDSAPTTITLRIYEDPPVIGTP